MIKGKVTIDEIARRAGVSKTSVSFAFNRPDRLSEATLQRILKVAGELGYNPDPLASNLKTGRTGCIGLVVPQPIPIVACNPHIAEFIEGIGEVCHEVGLSLMLVPPLQGNLHRAVVRAAVDGFLALGIEAYKEVVIVLQQRNVPCVMVDSDPVPGIPCVNIDDEAGAYAAMTHILQHNHQRIAIVGIEAAYAGDYREYVGLTGRRLNGYLRALGEVGLTLSHHNIRLVECKPTYEGGYEAFAGIWHSDWKPTAVVAMADVLALGVLRAAHDLGVEIPRDVSVVGYDDTNVDHITCPPLTTVRQPSSEKGRMAAQLLNDLIEGRPIESEYVVLPVDFIERASVRMV